MVHCHQHAEQAFKVQMQQNDSEDKYHTWAGARHLLSLRLCNQVRFELSEWLHAAVASNNKDPMLLSAPEAEYTVSNQAHTAVEVASMHQAVSCSRA